MSLNRVRTLEPFFLKEAKGNMLKVFSILVAFLWDTLNSSKFSEQNKTVQFRGEFVLYVSIHQKTVLTIYVQAKAKLFHRHVS